MLYDIRVTAEQLIEAGKWVEPGPDQAAVELAVDDRMLVVNQGDERAAFDTGGEPSESEEYLKRAPLDPSWIASVRAIIDYCWDSEHADYEREGGAARFDEIPGRAHIFEHLRAVRYMLESRETRS